MTTTSRYSGLAATTKGRTEQLNRTFAGMGADMKHRQMVEPADCDQPQTLEQALRVIASLKNQLTDAQVMLDADRAAAYSDAPAVVTGAVKYWDSKRVAKESGVAVCTICRNAAELGGTKLGGDWLFPAGTTYGHKRKRKSK